MNVLVTGASRGIGRAIAATLAVPGGRVVVNYLRNREQAQVTAGMVEEAGAEPVLVQADVRSPKDLERLSRVLDRVDVLVHNAAMGAIKPFERLRPNQWDLTLETTLRPFYLLSRLCLDRIPAGGSIVGISSLGPRKYTPGYAALGAAKAGVEALTRQMAVELAPRGIRVNTVCGGLVRTDTIAHFPDGQQMLDAAARLAPLGRVGEPQDMADAVSLLVDPRASFITGQVLVVDGGLSLR